MQEGGAKGGTNKGEEKLPHPSGGRDPQARDKVGAALGISGKTAEKAAKIADAMDELEAKGDVQAVEKVKEILKEQSIHAAYQHVKTPAMPAPEPGEKPASVEVAESPAQPATQADEAALRESILLFRDAQDVARILRDKLQRIADSPGGAKLRDECKSQAVKFSCPPMLELLSLLASTQPKVVGCVHCKGRAASVAVCPGCSGRGWMSAGSYRQLGEAKKAEAVLIKDEAA
jgi:hypothetical protein